MVAWFVKAFGYKTDHLASSGSNLARGETLHSRKYEHILEHMQCPPIGPILEARDILSTQGFKRGCF